MKLRTKILLGIGLGLILLCGGGGWLVASNFRSTTIALQEDARFTGEEILESLGRTWSMKDLRDAASADFLTSVPEESEKQAWLDKMKKELGAYQSGRAVTSEIKTAKGIEGRDVLAIVFTSEAQFQKRRAKVKMSLVMREAGGWQMAAFAADPLPASPAKP